MKTDMKPDMKRFCTPVLAGLATSLLLWAAGPAAAHQASDAFLNLALQGQQISQRLDISLRDLDRELVLDTNDDGQLSWGEVRQRWPEIERVAAEAVVLDFGGQACTPAAPSVPQLTEHSDGRHAVLMRTWQCEAPLQTLAVRYQLFQATDATHRGILQWRTPQGSQSQVLVPGERFVSLLAAAPTAAGLAAAASADAGPTQGSMATEGFGGFLAEGVHHILIGYDHILFLLALLLPAVMVLRRPGGLGAPSLPASARVMLAPPHALARSRWPEGGLQLAGGPPAEALGAGGSRAARLHPARPAGLALAPHWAPATQGRAVLLDVARVVTAFTVAHSITLALAVLGLLEPPSRWVESVIAASVLLAALNNLRPVVSAGRWKLTFAFGLVHGFGFAGALKDLGLGSGDLAWSLLGFNLGVELGQLAIVALFLPLAWRWRSHPAYGRWALRGGSVLIALLSLVWLLERVLDVSLLPGS